MLNPYSHQLKSTTICTVRKWHTYLRREQDHGCCLVRLVVRGVRGTAVSRSAASKSNGHFRSRRQAVRGGGNTHADKQNNVMCGGALCINCTLQFSIDKNHKRSLSRIQKFLEKSKLLKMYQK